MVRRKIVNVCLTIFVVAFMIYGGSGQASAQTAANGSGTAPAHTHEGPITQADRQEAAKRAKAALEASGKNPSAPSTPAAMNPGGTPDYFGNIPNYANSPQAVVDITVAITGGGGLGATATATVGGVSTLTVGAGGTGYTTPPTVNITGGGGFGATAIAGIANGVVVSLTLTNAGSLYVLPPTVTFVGGGGTGATATATVTPGAVTAINVTDGGVGYTSAPTLTITGSGAGATATATITGGSVTKITITAPGSGYGLKVDATGKIVGIRKFVSGLPGLGPTAANDIGQYIPIAVPDTTTYAGSDYYEIALVQYTEQLHKDLPATTLRGYVQIETTVNASVSKHIALKYPNGNPILNAQGVQVLAVDNPQYLGPIIVAHSYDSNQTARTATNGEPVRVKFTNYLPTGTGGNLFLPVDTTVMGAGMGPNGEVTGIKILNHGSNYTSSPTITLTGGGGAGATAYATICTTSACLGQITDITINNPGSNYTAAPTIGISGGGGSGGLASASFAGLNVSNSYTQNRATLHLHGGNTPWISDGTAHQWTTPASETTAYPQGVEVYNVPDMPDPGPGSITFFYTNEQSARLMFYHDHAYGLTRLNVYAGEAAGYLLTDSVESVLINGGPINYTKADGTAGAVTVAPGTVPDLGIPLVIQDKTFVDATTLANQDPTWNWGSTPGTPKTGDLWFPHVYEPNQNPQDMQGANAMGRWDYGPWFWPPYTNLMFGPVPNHLFGTTPTDNVDNPGTPTSSLVPEAFMDTPLVNGAPYPSLTVGQKVVRFRVLNASNDRTLNLQLYFAKSNGAMWNANGTLNDPAAGEVNMVQAVPGSGLPSNWPTDGRDGGVPDPAARGPNMIQIGTEGGVLPAPAVIPNQPVGYDFNRRSIVVLNVLNRALFLGPAERADVLVDFSGVPDGTNLILYNDAPAPVPGFDPRYDYYTGNPDFVSTGGTPTTQAGYGPDMRTVMQIRVSAAAGTSAALNLAGLNSAISAAFAATQPKPIVPEAAYNAAYNASYTDSFVRIQDTGISFFNGPLTKLNLTAGGSGYVSPTVSITGGGATTNATAAATVSPNNGVNTITLTTRGGGYSTPPTVTFSGPTGTGTHVTATGFTTILNGYVTSIILTNAGNGYLLTPAPTITFTGGGGTGTAATATIAANVIQTITLTNGGAGYNSAPTVTITGGTGAKAVAVGLQMAFQPKAIQELFDPDYGRMNSTLGVEIPNSTAVTQTTIPYFMVDPPTELIQNTDSGSLIGSLGDGTQIWKITHNGVDTHSMHWHLFNVQVINRVGWDGFITAPNANEVGWKDTVRMNPLEDIIVALRPIVPVVPFKVPNAYRAMDVTAPLGSTAVFTGIDPINEPAAVVNAVINYGWEYVWHCHLLGHEENDMMRSMPVAVKPDVPTTFTGAWNGGGTVINLSFKDNSLGETSFTLQRSASVNGPWSTVATLPQSVGFGRTVSYTDSSAPKTSVNVYRVIANNTIGDTAVYALPVIGYPNMTVSSAPLTSSAINPPVASIPNPPTMSGTQTVGGLLGSSSGVIRLTWNVPSNATGFILQRALISTGPWTVIFNVSGTGTTQYNNTGLTIPRTYYFRIIATGAIGNSSPSNVVRITTVPNP